MRARDFLNESQENAVAAIWKIIAELIAEGHTEVSPDVVLTKVSAVIGEPFMLKDLVAANHASPKLQQYISSINPSKIKFSTDILTVKNENPAKEKERSQATVSSMASRAINRSRLGEAAEQNEIGKPIHKIPGMHSLYLRKKGSDRWHAGTQHSHKSDAERAAKRILQQKPDHEYLIREHIYNPKHIDAVVNELPPGLDGARLYRHIEHIVKNKFRRSMASNPKQRELLQILASEAMEAYLRKQGISEGTLKESGETYIWTAEFADGSREQLTMATDEVPYAKAAFEKKFPNKQLTKVDTDWKPVGGSYYSGMPTTAMPDRRPTEPYGRDVDNPMIRGLEEEKDACYNKVKARYKVWPSAYASGALSKCRKVGASNWGNKSKK